MHSAFDAAYDIPNVSFGFDGHLLPDSFLAYVERSLPETTLVHIGRHLETCPRCASFLEFLRTRDPLTASRETTRDQLPLSEQALAHDTAALITRIREQPGATDQIWRALKIETRSGHSSGSWSGTSAASIDLSCPPAQAEQQQVEHGSLPCSGHQADDRIGELYDEIAALAAQGEGLSMDARKQLEQRWDELRQLQTEEAEQYRQAFEDSLTLPLDAGSRILKQARELRDKLEDLASTDRSSNKGDSSSSSAA